MKILSILLPACALLGIPATAQFFVKGGRTLNVISFEETPHHSFSTNTGYQLGLGYQGEIQPTFCYQFEMNFIQKGGVEIYEGTINDVHIRETIDTEIAFIEIPAMLKYVTGRDKVKFFVASGISVAFGADGDYHYDRQVTENGSSQLTRFSGDVKFGKKSTVMADYPVRHIYRETDVAFQFGAGVTFLNCLAIDARYGHGLVKMYDDEGTTRTLQLSLAVYFPKRK
jgi:hypothetical protein